MNATLAVRRDQRRAALWITLALVALGGLALHRVDALHEPAPAAAASAAPPHAAEVRRLFDAAVVMLHAKRHEDAVTALHRVLTYAPRMPEAHVNMGFALLGLKRLKEAREFFEGAMALAPTQANAYYGLALVHEAQGDLASATGAMRSYLHLARDEQAEHLARARAALWEWEQQRAPGAGANRR
ncbi:MAG: tetratricopeptide repeat protein [Aquincola sp.]|nr:tetratricopeptide repeat protein [Aquincola sp.]MDH4289571.1 tetratricopeptide repeat protein [Aquincola sp.]MDH5330154.1 tetratricopeptide repeat protein [Aquincola sp.]